MEVQNIPWAKRVCLDFDGVVHSCTTPYQAPEIIPDPPVDYAFQAIEEYLRAGFRVAIFSARSTKPEGRRAMMEWFYKHGMSPKIADYLEFPDYKPNADIYVDDKAFCFTGVFPTAEWIENFKPWNK